MPQYDAQERIAEIGERIAQTLKEVASGQPLKTPSLYVFRHEGRKYSLMILDVEDERA